VSAAIAARWSPAKTAMVLAALLLVPTVYASVRHHGHGEDTFGRTANPLHTLVSSTLLGLSSPFSVADRDTTMPTTA